MVILRNLEVYDNKPVGISTVLYLKDDEGRDWYESQALFDDATLKFVFDSAGIVVSASYDVSALWPRGNSVAEVPASDVPDGFDISGEWMFDGAKIVPRTYTSEEWLTRAEQERQNRLSAAGSVIADWRTELQLDVISDDDRASLIEWMSYIKSLKALSLSAVNSEKAYKAIKWPDAPVSS